jgi:hypothetical protein
VCPSKRSVTVPARSVASTVCERPLARLRRCVDTGSLLRRLQLQTVGVLIVVVGAAVSAQEYPIFSAAQLETAMKTIGLAFGLTKRALAKGDFDDAKDLLPRSREQLAASITFWRHTNKDDAVMMVRTALRTIDDLDAMLSTDPVDSTAVNLGMKQVDAACASCHAVYREQDPVTKAYRLKVGS